MVERPLQKRRARPTVLNLSSIGTSSRESSQLRVLIRTAMRIRRLFPDHDGSYSCASAPAVSHERTGSVRTPTLGARCPKSVAAISAQSPKRSSQPKRHGGCQAAAPPTPAPPPSVLVLAPAPARPIHAVLPAHQRLLRFPHGRANAAPKPRHCRYRLSGGAAAPPSWRPEAVVRHCRCDPYRLPQNQSFCVPQCAKGGLALHGSVKGYSGSSPLWRSVRSIRVSAAPNSTK